MTFENDSELQADALMGRLLRAGRADGPSPKALAAAPAAIVTLLSAPAAAALAPAASALTPLGKVATSPLILLKWIGIGALASGSALALVDTQYRGKAAAPAAAPISTAVPRTLASPTASPELAPQPVLPAAPPVASAPLVAASAPRSDVAREVASLDAARQALVSGDPARALQILSALEQLPRRALAPEATVLRVRALLAQGSVGEARRHAERFYESSPGSPQAAVLRSLIANSEMQTTPSRL